MKINTALRRIRQEFPPEIVEIFEAGVEATKTRTLEEVIEILQECVEISPEGTDSPADTVQRLQRFLRL